MAHLYPVSICLSLSYNGHEISIFAALLVSAHYSIYKSYPRMRSKHHDSKVQGDFLPPYLHGLVAQLHCYTQENGDSSIPYSGIWGIISGQCCLASFWLCWATRLGPCRVRHMGRTCSSSSLEWRWWEFSGAEHLKTHTDSLTRGKYKAVFRCKSLSTTAKQEQTLPGPMDASATIQIYVHGISQQHNAQISLPDLAVAPLRPSLAQAFSTYKSSLASSLWRLK